MFRRILIISAAAIALVASPALAQEGDGYTTATASTSENADGSVTVAGGGFPPNIELTWTVTEAGPQTIQGAIPTQAVVDQGTTMSDADGNYSFTTSPLPDGRYQIRVSGGGVTASSTVTVGDPTAAPVDEAASGGLPETGSDSSIPMARLGVILVAAGGVAVYAGKKRQGRRAAFINA